MRLKSWALRKKQQGQIVVEYVLLMTVAVAVAILLVKQIAGRESGNEGIIVQKWKNILKVIADDIPDQ